MEKINLEQIRTKYHYYTFVTNKSLESKGDDTEKSLKILAKKINEIIDVLSPDCEPKISTKWMPVCREKYFYIDDFAHVNYTHWDDDRSDDFRLKNNNVFQTEEEAVQAYIKIMHS